MILGYDLSNYSGKPSASTLTALRNKYDLRRAILGCQFSDYYAAQAEACLTAGVEYEAYLYLYDPQTYVEQLQAVLPQLAEYQPIRLWLDVEDVDAALPTEQQLVGVVEVAQQHYPAGIYTSAGYWGGIGNPDFGSRCPLWLAHWTNTPPVEPSGWDAGFGGWVRSPVVQYAGEVTLMGVSLDLDAWSA